MEVNNKKIKEHIPQIQYQGAKYHSNTMIGIMNTIKCRGCLHILGYIMWNIKKEIKGIFQNVLIYAIYHDV